LGINGFNRVREVGFGNQWVESGEGGHVPIDSTLLTVQGLGVRSSGFGVRVWGLGLRVEGLGFGVRGVWFKGIGYLGQGCRVPAVGLRG
jgi:hypothetical protein